MGGELIQASFSEIDRHIEQPTDEQVREGIEFRLEIVEAIKATLLRKDINRSARTELGQELVLAQRDADTYQVMGSRRNLWVDDEEYSLEQVG